MKSVLLLISMSMVDRSASPFPSSLSKAMAYTHHGWEEEKPWGNEEEEAKEEEEEDVEESVQK